MTLRDPYKYSMSSGRLELGALLLLVPPYPSHHQSLSLSSSDDHYHNCLIRRQDGQQDPPQGPSLSSSDRDSNVVLVMKAVGESISRVKSDPSLVL
ncbi:hypothetical protein Tco_0077699 [Tanacetum coccineum]